MDDDDVPEAVPIAMAPQEDEAEDEHAGTLVCILNSRAAFDDICAPCLRMPTVHLQIAEWLMRESRAPSPRQEGAILCLFS